MNFPCDIDWPRAREWLGTFAGLATAVAAVSALVTWRSHLRGVTKYRVAHKVLEEARLLRYFFYDARNPWIDPSELPPGYHNVVPNERTSAQEAEGYAYVYSHRYKTEHRQILVVARLRARAGTLFGEDLPKRMEELARTARSLTNFMREYVAQVRAGEAIAAQWPNQNWNQRVRESVTVDPDHHTDRFSLEFEQRFAAIESLLKKYK
jgi:hypothetical protein